MAGKTSIAWASVLILVYIGGTASVIQAQQQTPALGYDLRTGDLVQKQGPKELKRSTPPPLLGALPKQIENPKPECGPNAMYVFLRLRNVACELEQLKRELPLEKDGVNMLALKGAANHYGVDVNVIQANPSQLIAATPLIARMQSGRSPQEGHYVVLTQINDELVQVIDSADGATIRMPRSTFDREFTGYALAPNIEWSFPIASYVNLTTTAATICAAEIIFMIYLVYTARKSITIKANSSFEETSH